MEFNFHTNVNIQHVNMLPRTAYKLPYTSIEEYQTHPERHHMHRVTSLNGNGIFNILHHSITFVMFIICAKGYHHGA